MKGQTLIIDGGFSLVAYKGLVMYIHSETIIVVTLTVYPSPMPSSNICVFPPTSQRTTLPHMPKPQHDLPPHRPRNIRIRLLDPRLIPLIHNLGREIRVDGRDHQLHIYKQSAHAPQERKRKSTYSATQNDSPNTSAPHSQTPKTSASSPLSCPRSHRPSAPGSIFQDPETRSAPYATYTHLR